MPVLTVLTSSSHGLEGRVTRCVEKGDFLTAVQFDREDSNVLGDTAAFTLDDRRFSQPVQKLKKVNFELRKV